MVVGQRIVKSSGFVSIGHDSLAEYTTVIGLALTLFTKDVVAFSSHPLQEVRERSICAAMQTLHAMHLAELANTQSKTLYYNIDPFTERTPPPTLGRRSRRPSGADAPVPAVGNTAAAVAPPTPPVANVFARDVETDLYDVGKLLGEGLAEGVVMNHFHTGKTAWQVDLI